MEKAFEPVCEEWLEFGFVELEENIRDRRNCMNKIIGLGTSWCV